MANDLNADTDAYKAEEAVLYVVAESNKIAMPAGTDADSIYIAGLEKTDGNVESGKYKVSTVSEGSCEIQFHTDIAVGTEILVFYSRSVESAFNLNVTTNQAAARGEVIMTWPVLSASDDGAMSSVKGHLQIVIPMARVTAMPGFDTSYKTAATNAVTFSAMDAHRADDSWYSMHYIEG